MTPRSRGAVELEARQKPRWSGAGDRRARRRGARGHRRHRPRPHGGLLVIDDPDALPLLRRHQAQHRLSAAMIYQLAKMDGADRAERHRDQCAWCNVRLIPDRRSSARRPHPRAPPSACQAVPTRYVIAVSQQQRGQPLRGRHEVRPRGHPRRAGQGQPGAGDLDSTAPARPVAPGRARRAASRCTTSSPSLGAAGSSTRMAVPSSATSSRLGSEGRLVGVQLRGDHGRRHRDKPRSCAASSAEPRDGAFAVALDGIARSAIELLDFGAGELCLGIAREGADTLDFIYRGYHILGSSPGSRSWSIQNIVREFRGWTI